MSIKFKPPIGKFSQINGKCISLVGDDIDTDRIIPARFLKEISFKNMGEYAFVDERYDENGVKKNHPFNSPHYEGGTISVSYTHLTLPTTPYV